MYKYIINTECKKGKKGTEHDLLLGTVEDKVYNRYLGEHSKRKGCREESRVDETTLSWGLWRRRRETGAKGVSGAETQIGVAGKMPEIPVSELDKIS